MKRPLTAVFYAVLVTVAVLFATVTVVRALPQRSSYNHAVSGFNHTEKVTGMWLVETAAALEDTVTIYGSSELRTFDISTHPSNFFAANPAGFQVNLVGRGSCQSLIHALSIAAVGESLSGTKVVLITSPQSFVEDGIAPDLFMANFSELQYLSLMDNASFPQELKQRISQRVNELFDEYAADTGENMNKSASKLLANSVVNGNDAVQFLLQPYISASRELFTLKDRWASYNLMRETTAPQAVVYTQSIDWERERERAVQTAEQLTQSNDFGILDGYYSTYIGARLERQRDKDASLSYSASEEYGDLELLMDVCAHYGIEPLFVHVPLHGGWSDYTGFTAERRVDYYENVRNIIENYSNVTLIDLTSYEYEDYFLCDIMHLGWKGWLEVDKAIFEFYHQD